MSIPWDDIDAAIRPGVKVLVDAGFETFSSCEGHGISRPFVQMQPCDLDTVAQTLIGGGAGGFDLFQARCYDDEGQQVTSWVEVQFWGYCHLPGWTPGLERLERKP